MTNFDNVWAWGNPLLSENRTFAAALENHTSYMMLATVTRNMFYATYNAWLQELFRAELTIDNLLEMMRLYAEACRSVQLTNDIKVYIAHRLNCDERRVTRMLLFVDVPEVLENLTLLQPKVKKEYVVIKEQSRFRAPTSAEVQKMMAYITHPCAAGFEGCVGEMKGRFAICSRCHKQLGSHIEAEWDELTRKWLPAEVRRIRKQWQRDARNTWYRQQYTEITEEELEKLSEDSELQLVS